MKLTRLFLAEATERSVNGFHQSESLARRFERSPAGWCLFVWLCLTVFVPPLLLYYDWLNGHIAASLYVHHIWPILIAPIRELFNLLSWAWGS